MTLGYSHPIEALLYGLAIVGAAFMLSWGAEAAQLDVSAGLAIALLAFVAVLPEYAVDLVFAFKAGSAVGAYGPACRPPGGPGETPCSLALANMTGANRLLIGIGWSMVVFVAWYRSRRVGVRLTEVQLDRSHAVELAFLAHRHGVLAHPAVEADRDPDRRGRPDRHLRRLHGPDRLGARGGAASRRPGALPRHAGRRRPADRRDRDSSSTRR